jgi:hypothetical protein
MCTFKRSDHLYIVPFYGLIPYLVDTAHWLNQGSHDVCRHDGPNHAMSPGAINHAHASANANTTCQTRQPTRTPIIEDSDVGEYIDIEVPKSSNEEDS